jgi:hypothetical protein
MNPDYWLKQTTDKPLYSDMLWSRPENKLYAGKLLIIGGNAQGFAAAGEAYTAAARTGIGVARMMLPDVLHKVLGRDFAAGEFVPSTPSGSFSTRALAEALAMAGWADGVLLAGDLGRNSETAILLEKFVTKYAGPLVITKDAADYCLGTPGGCADRPETCFVISLAQLQKLAISAKFTTAFTFDMDILRFIEALHIFTELHPLHIVVKHLDNIFVASGGRVSSTRLTPGQLEQKVWRVRTAAACATWWIQNPGKPFESLTTALVAD